jgi:hypothetical protein
MLVGPVGPLNAPRERVGAAPDPLEAANVRQRP